MEDNKIIITTGGRADNPNPSEVPPRNLREILDHIDSGMPEDLEIWDENTPRGDRVKKKKEFEPQQVESDIISAANAISTNPKDQEAIIQQIAYIYDSAFEKLNIPDPESPGAWRYDKVFAGLVDRFFVRFPNQLNQAVQGKSNGKEIVENILSITTTGLDRITLIQGDGPEIREANHSLPHHVSDVCVAGSNLAIYSKGGTEDDSTEKQRFIESVKKTQENSETLSSHDVRLYGERARFIAEANDILIAYPGSLNAFNDYVLHLSEDAPQLFVDMEKQSLTNIALAAKDIAELTGVAPGELISEFENTAFKIAKVDKVASIVFIKFGARALSKATRTRGYNFDKAQEFLNLTNSYLCAANNNRGLIDGRFLDENIGGFLDDGLVDFIMQIPVDGFIDEVIKDAQSLNGEFGAKQVAKVRHAVNMIIVAETISGLAKKPITPQEKVDFYRSLVKLDKLPYGIIKLRQNVANPDNSNVHPTNNGNGHLLTVMENFANSEYPMQHATNLGLTELTSNPYFAALSLETGLGQDKQIFADYVLGLGILNNSVRYRFGNEKFFDFIPKPETEEGKNAMVIAIANLGKIYSQAQTEVDQNRLDELLVYVLSNDQLRIPFFMHLYQSANYETLESLTWVTRLAGTDNTEGSEVDEPNGLKQMVDDYLSRELMNENFRLPEKAEGITAGPLTVGETNRDVGLAKRVDSTQPLGKAISIIAAADDSPETRQQVADALAKVRMRSIADAKTVTSPIISAFSSYLNLDTETLNDRMFTFISGAEVVDEIREISEMQATLTEISAILGMGPLPALSYSHERNAIIVVEDYPGGFTVDGLGEEIMHWVREGSNPTGNVNPVVNEFWGNIGRRVARAALNVADTQTKADNYEEIILKNVEKILEVERYRALNVGYTTQLRDNFVHAIGYEAGSNVDLSNLPEHLIEKSNDYLLENYIKVYGPKEEWFIAITEKVKDFYIEYAKEYNIEEIKLEDILAPIVDVLDLLPYLDRQKIRI